MSLSHWSTSMDLTDGCACYKFVHDTSCSTGKKLINGPSSHTSQAFQVLQIRRLPYGDIDQSIGWFELGYVFPIFFISNPNNRRCWHALRYLKSCSSMEKVLYILLFFGLWRATKRAASEIALWALWAKFQCCRTVVWRTYYCSRLWSLSPCCRITSRM